MTGPERESERRDATIRAVWACVARGGIEGTTIDAVASIAGFSKGVIHYWFASKKDMLLAAFESFLSSYDREIAEILGRLGREPDSADALDAVVSACLPPFSPSDLRAAPYPVPAAGARLSPAYKARLFLQFFSLAITNADFAAVVTRNYERQGDEIGRCLRALDSDAAEEEIVRWTAEFIAVIDGFSLHRVLGYLPFGDRGGGDSNDEHAAIARRWLDRVKGGRKGKE